METDTSRGGKKNRILSIRITESQDDFLNEYSRELGISSVDVVRHILDSVIQVPALRKKIDALHKSESIDDTAYFDLLTATSDAMIKLQEIYQKNRLNRSSILIKKGKENDKIKSTILDGIKTSLGLTPTPNKNDQL